MSKRSLTVLVAALLLLLLSFLPWPAGNNPPAAAPTSPGPESVSAVEQGRALFLAKGCTACHRHGAIDDQANIGGIGPDLTTYRPDPDFLRRWLRDPAAVRPGTFMPNLQLSDAEIEALLFFLSNPE